VLMQLPTMIRRKLLPRVRFTFDAEVRAFLKQMVPGLFSLAVYQVNIIVLRRFASNLGDGGVSHYYMADRLLELVNGVFAIAIAQGSFTSMNRHAQSGDIDKLKSVWRYGFQLQNMIAIPAAVGLFAVATPIVSVVFFHGAMTWESVQQTALCVTYASAGLIASATVRGTVQVFFALSDRKTPLWVSVVVVLTNAGIGMVLLRTGLGVAALSLTLTVSYVLQAVLLVALLRRRIGSLGLVAIVKHALTSLVLAAIACSAAALICRFGAWDVPFSMSHVAVSLKNIAVLFASIGVAAILYGTGVVAVRMPGTEVVTARLKRLK
jgi:putative peptidoglycan lipid II flippase